MAATFYSAEEKEIISHSLLMRQMMVVLLPFLKVDVLLPLRIYLIP